MASNTGGRDLDSARVWLVPRVVPRSAAPEGVELRRPFENLRGSAVMPVAKVNLEPEWILDELELRMTRCMLDGLPLAPTIRMGVVRPIGESLHRIAKVETHAWWNTHRLSDVDETTRSSILQTMFERSPRFLAWAAVPLVEQLWGRPLQVDQLMRLIHWITAPEPVEQVVRDAVALGIVSPWFASQTEAKIREIFEHLCRGGNLPQTRLALVAMAAYVRDQDSPSSELLGVALEACWRLADHVEPNTAMSVGWLLKELVARDEELVLPTLIDRIQNLSRQAMRTAIERLPRELRVRLTARWSGRERSRCPRNVAPLGLRPC